MAADENITPIEDVEGIEDPTEALEAYARLIEHQQEVIDEHQQTIAEQAEGLMRASAQIEALRDSLTQQVDETVYMKSEIMLGQQREQQYVKQIEGLQSMLGMGEPEGADSREA